MNNLETAYVLVQSKVAHEMEVMSEILKLEDVKEVKGTFGVYDIFVKIKAESSKKIEEIITKKNSFNKKCYFYNHSFSYT